SRTAGFALPRVLYCRFHESTASGGTREGSRGQGSPGLRVADFCYDFPLGHRRALGTASGPGGGALGEQGTSNPGVSVCRGHLASRRPRIAALCSRGARRTAATHDGTETL